MTIEQNKDVVRKFIDAFNGSDFEVLETITSPEIFDRMKNTIHWIDSTFGDHVLEITQIIAEGEDVAIRVDSSGRHIGEWMDIRPTGKSWNNYGVEFFRLHEGKIVDLWTMFDIPNHINELGGEIKVIIQE